MLTDGEDLTTRRAYILGAIVEEHVRTAAPVGSKAVQERQEMDVSTATIRNEMLALEHGGYIHQPHTSAGRVPADLGYRTYVDRIMAPRPPHAEDIAWVRAEYRRAARDAEALYRTTSRVLSRMTSAPALVMAPPEERRALVDIRLAPVSSTIVLLTYATEPGGRFERLLEFPEPLTAGQVVALGSALQRRYCGREIGALTLCSAELLEEETAPFAVPEDLLDQVKATVEGDQEQRVYVDGAAFSLDYPEYQELEHLRPLMRALDEERIVRRALRPATRRTTMTVTIGHEHRVEDLRRCALVAQAYLGPRGNDVGVVAVLGPTRLDYQMVITAVHMVAEGLGHAFAETSREERGEG